MPQELLQASKVVDLPGMSGKDLLGQVPLSEENGEIDLSGGLRLSFDVSKQLVECELGQEKLILGVADNPFWQGNRAETVVDRKARFTLSALMAVPEDLFESMRKNGVVVARGEELKIEHAALPGEVLNGVAGSKASFEEGILYPVDPLTNMNKVKQALSSGEINPVVVRLG